MSLFLAPRARNLRPTTVMHTAVLNYWYGWKEVVGEWEKVHQTERRNAAMAEEG
jgi:hypothetical protein